MKKFKNYFLSALLFTCPLLVFSAGLQPAKRSASQIEKEWFYKGEWRKGLKMVPDISVDIHSFYTSYKKHPKRWEKAFAVLRDSDLVKLPLGKKVLGNDVFVNVQEYTTIDPAGQKLEGHKKYIDLQYVVSGREFQGTTKIKNLSETIDPYRLSADVGHYKAPFIRYTVAGPDRFEIYFPDDLHDTNIQFGEKSKVRKLVFKIAVD